MKKEKTKLIGLSFFLLLFLASLALTSDEKGASMIIPDEEIFVDASFKSGEIMVSPSPHYVVFGEGKDQVGQLYWENGLLKFEGDADASAQLFFDYVILRYLPPPHLTEDIINLLERTLQFVEDGDAPLYEPEDDLISDVLDIEPFTRIRHAKQKLEEEVEDAKWRIQVRQDRLRKIEEETTLRKDILKMINTLKGGKAK